MSPRNNPGQGVRLFAIAAGLAALTGCADHASAPTGFDLAASRSGLPFTAGLASPAWQTTEGSLVRQASFNPQVATRAYSCWASRSIWLCNGPKPRMQVAGETAWNWIAAPSRAPRPSC